MLIQTVLDKHLYDTLTRIHQAVGFRFITKFGEKGIINLGQMVPVIGGVIGGGVDLVTTKTIANNAYRLFIKGNIDSNEVLIEE